MTKENRKPDPRRDDSSKDENLKDLEPRTDDKVKGGRDPSTGLPSGKRQWTPLIAP